LLVRLPEKTGGKTGSESLTAEIEFVSGSHNSTGQKNLGIVQGWTNRDRKRLMWLPSDHGIQGCIEKAAFHGQSSEMTVVGPFESEAVRSVAPETEGKGAILWSEGVIELRNRLDF
jgi:hypothetical protein